MTTAGTYLVVVDETPECRLALRFAALRARRTGEEVMLIHVLRPPQFVQWGRVQETIAAEQQEAAERLLADAAVSAASLLGRPVQTAILSGKPSEQVLGFVRDHPQVRSLVLAAASRGRPGPLVEHFAGERAGSLPCLIILVPGGLDEDELDRLT
jgi:nucleotide-binding universal stress UspA family protein